MRKTLLFLFLLTVVAACLALASGTALGQGRSPLPTPPGSPIVSSMSGGGESPIEGRGESSPGKPEMVLESEPEEALLPEAGGSNFCHGAYVLYLVLLAVVALGLGFCSLMSDR